METEKEFRQPTRSLRIGPFIVKEPENEFWLGAYTHRTGLPSVKEPEKS